MTKEEARQIIAAWLVSSKGEKGQCGYIEGWFYEKDAEAFYMAIEALEQESIKFYYVESLDDYWVGRRLDNFYYATWHRRFGFIWSHSKYLPWGEHIVDENTLWKEHTYPSEPKEIPFTEWIVGFTKKYFQQEPTAEYSSDVISRQAAIEVVHSYFKDKLDELPTEIDEDGYEVYCDMDKMNAFLSDNKCLSKKIKNLPSAQLKCKTDGDTISRQDAMNELKEMQDYISYKIFCAENNPTEYAEDYIRNMEQQSVGIAHAEHRILELPSAQPEIIRCKDSIVYRKDVVEALYKALRTQLRGTFADSMSLAMSMAQALPSAEQIQTMQEQERQEDIYEYPNRLGEVHINYIYCPFCGVRMESEDNDDK